MFSGCGNAPQETLKGFFHAGNLFSSIGTADLLPITVFLVLTSS